MSAALNPGVIPSTDQDIARLILDLNGKAPTDADIAVVLRHPMFQDWFVDIACDPGWLSACIAFRGTGKDLRTLWWDAAERKAVQDFLEWVQEDGHTSIQDRLQELRHGS